MRPFPAVAVARGSSAMTASYRNRRALKAGQPNDFSVRDKSELLSALSPNARQSWLSVVCNTQGCGNHDSRAFVAEPPFLQLRRELPKREPRSRSSLYGDVGDADANCHTTVKLSGTELLAAKLPSPEYATDRW